MRTYIAICTSIAVVFTAFVVYKAKYTQTGETAKYTMLTSTCDLNKQNCQAFHQRLGKIGISITPRPIQAKQKLSLQVHIEKDVSLVQIDFQGVDMNMGYHRPALRRAREGIYQAETILPSCTHKKMKWKATTRIQYQDELFIAAFPFTIISP
ncbi:MAG: hypothetical protein AAF518_10235 [Spirochaetota bacterium]